MPSTVGRYRIDRVLGSGAFASVWLAHDELLDAQVAVKVLAGGLIDDLDVRGRFLEEAKILRRADSERLVRVHDIGELEDGRPYFVMSYADLGTLSERMKKRELPVAEALRLAVEVAHGVEVINRLGIIHRDLKPSNVLFQSTTDGGERLLIADLGLAKALAHASGAFTLPVGTPGYMSPEQARFGGGLDVRADVYGLGALTYHLVTGRPPSTAPVLVPPSAIRPGIPHAVDEILMRALESDRERRWPSAEAFAAALNVPLAAARDDTTRDDTVRDDTTRDDSTHEETMQDGREDPRGRPLPPATDLTLGEQPNERGDHTARLPPPPDPHDRTLRQPLPDPQDHTIQQPPPDPRDPTIQHPPPPDQHDHTIRQPVLDEDRFPPHQQADPSSETTRIDLPVRPRGDRGHEPPARTGETSRGRLLVAAGLAAVLLVGTGGAYVIGKLAGGSKPDKPKDGFVTVTDTTGRLSLRVPPTWKLQTQHNKWPVPVSDGATSPALRATPNYDQFVKDDVAVPGVFAGLTHDLNATLPPTTLGSHRSKCTEGKTRPYRHGSLSGKITPWNCGSITISEVGLRDSGGKFAMWVRVKLTGPPDVTTKILDSIRTKG